MNKSALIRTLTDMIDTIEQEAIDLQLEQDSYEEELNNYDPDDEDAVEPEEVDNSEEIRELDEAVEYLRKAKELLYD